MHEWGSHCWPYQEALLVTSGVFGLLPLMTSTAWHMNNKNNPQSSDNLICLNCFPVQVLLLVHVCIYTFRNQSTVLWPASFYTSSLIYWPTSLWTGFTVPIRVHWFFCPEFFLSGHIPWIAPCCVLLTSCSHSLHMKGATCFCHLFFCMHNVAKLKSYSRGQHCPWMPHQYFCYSLRDRSWRTGL